jgi:hypothetical protein
MKLITKIATECFLQGKTVLLNNTRVLKSGNKFLLELFGNVIAERIEGDDKFYISTCGWNSDTTKERLNALPNVHIQQKQGQWFLNGKHWDGHITEINL